jgi:hypothetical protein
MQRLLFIAFFLSACASGKLHFVDNGKQKLSQKNTVLNHEETSEMNETSYDATVTQDSSIARHIAENSSPLDPTKSLARTIVEKINSRDGSENTEINNLLERLDREKEIDRVSEGEDHLHAGKVILIIALILSIIAILFVYRMNAAASSNPDTAIGCATSLTNLVIFTFFAVLFGIAAAVMLIIGLIFIGAAKAEQKQAKTNSES